MKKEPVKKIKREEAIKDYSYYINETGEYREAWRIFRIMAEFVEGYQFLRTLEKEVTILGSARLLKKSPYYKIAYRLGKLLGKHGFTTVTGGGPGIMEAANRGAHEVGGTSVGLNIQLPFEQRTNPYVNKSAAFYYFFTRKVMLTSPAHAFVFLPGGFGTLDEFFEVVDHIVIGKMCRLPVVLIGKSFWNPIVKFVNDRCTRLGSTDREEVDTWYIVDTAKEAFDYILDNKQKKQLCELSPLGFRAEERGEDWRIFHIMAELVEGFEFLTGVVEGVNVLGTKAMKTDSEYYKTAYALGKHLAQDGYTVVTGGAGGIAEAANKGAKDAGGASLGVGMVMEGKSLINPYVTKSITFQFPFTRKLIVTAPSKAFVFFPGSLGTLHQFFEILTLIQTGKMQKVPIFLFDSEYWGSLDKVIRNILARDLKTISSEDAKIYTIVNTEKEILDGINTFRGRYRKNTTI